MYWWVGCWGECIGGWGVKMSVLVGGGVKMSVLVGGGVKMSVLVGGVLG